jgi:beta-N-acetylhexosaminidase
LKFSKKIPIFLLCLLLAGGALFARPKRKAAASAKTPGAVRQLARGLTLREKVAQLVFLPFYGDAPNTRSEEYRRYVRWVRNSGIGGLVLVNRVENGSTHRAEPYAMAAFLNRMQRSAKVPLLVAGDFERGDSMRVASRTLFPHNMAFAATRNPAFSRLEGEVTARQARALGVPWILAPVADVNNNPDNPIVNIRAYSENPEEVAAHVRAYIEGAREGGKQPVLVTIKHFPGHGDASIDSHVALAVNSADRARLEAVEFGPFRAGIAAGADAVMTAHISVPALDETGAPATLSGRVLTGLLRKELGFEGLIATDALDMQGVTKQGSSGAVAVRAIEAGADVLLMPPDPDHVIDAIVRAVSQGRISRDRIEESAMRVLDAKARVGLSRQRLVDPDAGMDELDTPEDIERVQEIADRAVTLVKNEAGVVPLRRPGSTVFMALAESCCSEQGRAFAAEIGRRVPGASFVTLQPSAGEAEIASAAAKALDADAVVVAAFVSVAAYRGSVALSGNYPKVMDALIQSGRPVVLVALGSPYLARSFPQVSAYLATYSTVAPSEIAAAKALLGAIPIQGRLPVTIPGIAQYGDGIQVPVP